MPNSISLTSVYLPPAKAPEEGTEEEKQVVERELEFFRAELLRQKIVFEAELRRQREVFEERTDMLQRDLASKDEEMKQLRRMVDALVVRMDNERAARPVTPVRRAPSASPAPVAESDVPRATPATSRAATPRQQRAESPYRRTPSRQQSPARRDPGDQRQQIARAQVRPHLTTVSRNSTLARLGSVSHATAWK